MPSDAAIDQPAVSSHKTHDSALPAGAGLALAVLVGSLLWMGIFALLM